MKVVWSRRAVQHLVALREYIGKDSEQNAALVAGRILDAVDLLRARPELGRPGRVAGTRELVVPDTPYIITLSDSTKQARIDGGVSWPAKMAG